MQKELGKRAQTNTKKLEIFNRRLKTLTLHRI